MPKNTFLLLIVALFPVGSLMLSCESPQREPSAATATHSGSKLEKIPTDAVWVGKSDEAKSCAKEKGIALDKMGAELKAAAIKTFAKKKLHDGKMRIQMCDTDKGDLNGFLIAKSDLKKADSLGFKPVPAPPHE